jgi:hypothetical protein
MKVEDLLKQLRDGGLDDEAIKALLSEAIASLEGAAEDKDKKMKEEAEAEKKEAEEILGVQL